MHTFQLRAPLAAFLLPLGACLASLAGCPEVTRHYEPTFASIQREIFNVACTTQSCHGSPAFKGRLDLREGRAHASLVGTDPDNEAARAAGLKRVEPGNPDRSFLVAKLQGPGPDQGDRMPSRNLALPPAALAAVKEWISQGARP